MNMNITEGKRQCDEAYIDIDVKMKRNLLLDFTYVYAVIVTVSRATLTPKLLGKSDKKGEHCKKERWREGAGRDRWRW